MLSSVKLFFRSSGPRTRLGPATEIPFSAGIKSQIAGFKENIGYLEVRVLTATGAYVHKGSRNSDRLALVSFMEET